MLQLAWVVSTSQAVDQGLIQLGPAGCIASPAQGGSGYSVFFVTHVGIWI